jgi:hypothetical protein
MMGSLVRSLLVGSAFLVGSLSVTLPAHADRLIIKQPGAHPKYSFEAEPHLVLGFINPPGGYRANGIGLGFRGSIPILDNGFIAKINNSVAIGFGADWVHYSNPTYRYCDARRCYWDDRRDWNVDFLWLPLVMQWNFWLSENWSVFGEPGFAVRVHHWSDPFGSDTYVNFDWFVGYAGGRFHFTDNIALTMRIGYPTFSVGVSFLL